MFLILTASAEPTDDALGRALADILAKRDKTLLAGIYPRCVQVVSFDRKVTPDKSIPRVLLRMLETLVADESPKVIFTTTLQALSLLSHIPALKNIPFVLLWDGQGQEQAVAEDVIDSLYRACEIWSTGSKNQFAKDIKQRIHVLPNNFQQDEQWIALRLQQLLQGKKMNQAHQPLTSIIIPVFNALPHVKACLESIKRNTSAPHETIVINNGSDAETSDYLKQRRDIKLISNNRNLGFARAINQGMRAAQGRYLLWLNSDTIVTPRWLELLVDSFGFEDDIGAVGPVTNSTVGPQEAVKLPAMFQVNAGNVDLFAALWSLRHASHRQEIHRLTGFCLMLKRKAVEAVGMLDERFGVGCYEEYDYCMRLRQAGYRMAIAWDTFIYHAGSATFGGHKEMLVWANKNKDVFIQKWCAHALEFLDELNPLS